MNWGKITDIILITSIAVLAVFALLGLIELIRRKSIKKVDKSLLAMIPPLILMSATYFIFDKIWILNMRPDGSGEPSFPSTHTMIVATIFLMAIIALPKYIKNKPLRIILDIVMLSFIAVVPVGRVLANKHWVSDVVAGLIFAVIFAAIYYLITRSHKNAKHLHEDN